MKHTRFTLSALMFVASLTTATSAQSAPDFAGMSRAEFVDVYEDVYVEMLHLNRALLVRLDPDFGKNIDVDTPITPDERVGFGCTFDKFAAAGQLDSLTQQLKTIEFLRTRLAEDPQFSFVDVVFDPATTAMMQPDLNKEMAQAMIECETMTIARKRMDLSATLFQTLQKKAVERGLVEGN